MSSSTRRRRWSALVATLATVASTAAVVTLTASPSSAVATRTICNTTSIAIPTTGTSGSSVPSTIAVAGFAGTITDVNVVLNNLSHGAIGDLNVSVSPPAGPSRTLINEPGNGARVGVNNRTYTFDDAASTAFPANPTGSTYRPTQPFSNLNGQNPNGTWTLNINDTLTLDSGSLAGGWCVQVTTERFSTTTTGSVGAGATFASTTITPSVAVATGVTAPPAAPVQYRLGSTGGFTTAPNAGPFTLTGLAPGTYTLFLRYAQTANYAESTSSAITFTVAKAAQTITFDQPTSPRVAGDSASVTATSTSGLPVAITSTTPDTCTVSGGTVAYTNAGTCTLAADQGGNANYLAASQVTRSVAVDKAAQVITFAQPVSPRLPGDTAALTASSSSGLPVVITSATPGTCTVTGGTVSYDNAGTCTLVADQAGNANVLPADQVTRTVTVDKAAQVITFDQPTSPVTAFDDATVTATSTSGLPVTITSTTPGTCTVTGDTVSYDNAGTCTLAANQAGNGNVLAADQVTRSVTIDKIAQSVSFGPVPANPRPGGSVQVTATGGDSGAPVVITSTTPDTCTVSSSVTGAGTTTATVVYQAAGRCLLAADQAGTANYTAAPQVTQSIGIGLVATTTRLVLSRTSATFGQDVAVSATVTAPAGPFSGAVQFTVDGVDVGAPAPVVDGRATGPVVARGAGEHRVTARFVSSDARFADSGDVAQFTILKASTTTAVSVDATGFTARVSVVAPGAGAPSGSVTFVVNGSEVGTAPLQGGVATLPSEVGDVDAAGVVARYSGDDSFLASSGSVRQSVPTLTATVRSRTGVTRFGWHRTPVSVSFTCDADGAQLVGDCPAPVTVSSEGRRQRVSRTITTTTGETATATVRVSVDRTAPRVRAAGVTNGATYSSAPRVRCVGSDALSGIATCTVAKRKVNARVTAYTVRATDRAGNITRVTGRYTVR